MSEEPGIKQKNRIRVNLNSCELEVESTTESLEKVFEIADQIARNLGKGPGLDGKTLDEKIRGVGIG